MPRKEHHIVPNSRGGWDVKRSGGERGSLPYGNQNLVAGYGERASSHTETKKEAINIGRTISKNQGTELVIHNKDGRIAYSDSHGNDPCPPKDHK